MLTERASPPVLVNTAAEPSLRSIAAVSLARRLVAPLVLAVAVAPSVVWMLLDASVWPWDQAWYGQVSVELWYTLVRTPQAWPTALVHAFAIKAPGVAWLGELFVPLAPLIGGVDRALLLSVLITQAGTLWLLYWALSALSQRRSAPLVTTLLAASFPLFVGLAHQYLVEMLQTFAITWFVVLMVRGRDWHPLNLGAQLVAAAGLAMLAKVTSPLYALGPGLVVLGYLVASVRRDKQRARPRPPGVRCAGALALALVLGLGALGWYAVNVHNVLAFTQLAYSSPVAAMYGAADPYPANVAYWIGALRENFAYVPVAVVLLLLGAVAVVRRLGRAIARIPTHTALVDLCAVVAVAEIVLMLATAAAGDNRENRYLLPLAPYVALLVAWSLIQLDALWSTLAVLGVAGSQLVAVNGQALAAWPPSPTISVWLYPVRPDATLNHELDALVNVTCSAATDQRYTIVGVEEPSMNANTLAYVSARQHEAAGIRCYYTSLGYAASDVQQAWDRFLSLNPVFYVTLKRDVPRLSPAALNQVSAPITDRVEQSGRFVEVAGQQDPDVVLFRRLADQQAGP